MPEIEPNARKRGRPRAFHEKTEGNIVQSLDKAIHTLRAVSQQNGMALSEIAEATGTSAPTVYRSLITMQQHGVVQFEETTQLWRVGVEAFRIGSRFLTNTSVVEQARPVMQSLMNATGETANLGIVSNNEVVFLSQVETHEPIRAFFRPGTRGAVHASGIGKAILAFSSDAQAASLLSNLTFTSFTENTLMTHSALQEMRLSARELGFAVDDEERTLGMRCIAAPIYNNFGEPVAGVSVSGPTVRVGQEKIPILGKQVLDAANQITASTGGTVPRPLED